MSQFHQNAFEETRREYNDVVRLVVSDPKATGTQSVSVQVDRETTLATLQDAYALLLIAQAEGFLRVYLRNSGVVLPRDPKLVNLINQVFSHFNASNPRVRLRKDDARALHDLREQRNLYAHGYSSRVFPSIPFIVQSLGKFFQHLP